MAEIKQKLLIPSVPSFIMIETATGVRQDGFQESSSISISKLSDETLIELAEEWKAELLAKAYRKRLHGENHV